VVRSALRRAWGNDYVRAGVILFALHVIFYHDIYLSNRVLVSPDATSALTTTAPLKRDHAETGRVPLWNPYIFSGMPSFAALSYTPYVYLPGEVLDPLTRVLHLPRLSTMVFHIFLAGFFTFVLLRRRGLWSRGVDFAPALFGGVVYMFTPYLITMLAFGHGSQMMSAAYIPLALWVVIELTQRRTLLWLGLAALVLGFQMQRAHIQIIYYTWMLIGAYYLYALYRALREKGKVSRSKGREAISHQAHAVLSLLPPSYSISEQSHSETGSAQGTSDRCSPLQDDNHR